LHVFCKRTENVSSGEVLADYVPSGCRGSVAEVRGAAEGGGRFPYLWDWLVGEEIEDKGVGEGRREKGEGGKCESGTLLRISRKVYEEGKKVGQDTTIPVPSA
jgi:hypothetical protein